MRHFSKYTSFGWREVFAVILTLYFINCGYAQEDEFNLSDYRIRFGLETQKTTDNSRVLKASFIGQNKKDRKDRLPVHEAEIVFYNQLGDDRVELGKSKTDETGTAVLVVPPGTNYLKDEEGYIEFIARFNGNEGMRRKEADLKVRDLFLDISAEEIDSVKTVVVHTFVIDSTGQRIPQEDVDVKIAVRGMLSDLALEEGSTEDGTLEFEFPDDIPGDKDGEFFIIASIEDNDEFGNLEYMEKSDWGVFDDVPHIEKNELWTEAAPIWMYVILTVMLVGVWANYVYTLIKIRKIWKLGA